MFFIERGVNGSEPALNNALEIIGNVEMANILLNSGNDKLRKGDIRWGESHPQYKIIEVNPGTEVILWGGGK
jgi:hypothetical protein